MEPREREAYGVTGPLPDWGLPLSSDRDLRPAKTDEGVALPSGRNLPPLDPLHKAFILYFMFFADVASTANMNDMELMALVMCAHYPASEILKEVYNLHIRPDSIQAYFGHVTTYAKNAGDNLHSQKTVAKIISRQVKDLKTFDTVTSTLVNRRDNEKLSLSAQWFIWKVYGATGGASRNSNTQKVLRDRLEKYFNSKAPDLLGYQDLEMKQSFGIDKSAASNYQYYKDLKDHLNDIRWNPGSED